MRCVRVILCGLVMMLAVRFFYRAAHTELGMRSVALAWRDATVGWFVGKYEPIPARIPIEQAEWWLGETDRILAETPHDAELMMGAALILDGPGMAFIQRHTSRLDDMAMNGLLPPAVDWPSIRTREDEFERVCGPRCLELAAAATRLEPEKAAWRQMRAQLLFRWPIAPGDEPYQIRVPDLLAQLDECAKHDTSNGLYDLLAAYRLFEQSARVEFVDEVSLDERLVITDAARFRRAEERLRRALAKPQIKVSDASFLAVGRFLSRSRLSAAGRDNVAANRKIVMTVEAAVLSQVRFQTRLATKVATPDDGNRAALRSLQQAMKLIDRYVANPPRNHSRLATVMRKVVAKQILELSITDASTNMTPGANPGKPSEVVAQLERAEVDDAITAELLARWNAEQAKLAPGQAVAAWFVGLVPSFVCVFGAVSLLLLVVPRRDAERLRIGTLGLSISMVVVLLVSFTVLGLAPAELISRPIQKRVITWLVVLLPIVVCGCAAWGWLRRRGFRFGVRSFLLASVVVGGTMGLLVRWDYFQFLDEPFDWYLPARGGAVFGAERIWKELESAGVSRWGWAAVQWNAYYGPYVSVGLWTLVSFVLAWRKSRRERAGDALTRAAGRLQAAVGRPLFIFTALILVIYLALSPGVMSRADEIFQAKMSVWRDPSSVWRRLEELEKLVRSDKQLMKEFANRAPMEKQAGEKDE